MKRWQQVTATALVLLAACIVYSTHVVQGGDKKSEARVFEMRTYYAEPGKMEALHARFREHTCKLV